MNTLPTRRDHGSRQESRRLRRSSSPFLPRPLRTPISERYQAPLPLIVYVAGAGLAVAMSFAFVMYRNAPPPTDEALGPERRVWRWLRVLLGALG